MFDDRGDLSAQRPGVRLQCCFDFRISSEIPLPELPFARPDDDRPIVSIRRARVPARLPGGGQPQWHLEARGDEALLTVPDVARFLITGGVEIQVDRLPNSTERQVRLFLLGSALGILAHQRGLLPLHANAVVVAGNAYAFCGPSGAGKSTLAAHFERRGYSLLSDDVCAVELCEIDQALAWPGIPQVKLWKDAALTFGYAQSALEPVAEQIEKYRVPYARPRGPRPVPLKRLYVLSSAAGDHECGIVRLTGSDAMAAVVANTYRGLYLAPMGLSALHFRRCAAVLRSVRVYAAPRRWGFDSFDREAERLERHMLDESVE